MNAESQCGVLPLEKCCELCTVMCAREKCASARVQEAVVSTLRRTHGFLLLAEFETQIQQLLWKIFELEQDCGQTFWLTVTTLSLSFLSRLAPVS